MKCSSAAAAKRHGQPRSPTRNESTTMDFEYGGYLKGLLYAPDPKARENVPSIVFTSKDLAHWNTRDFESDFEWKRIPALRQQRGEIVRLTGRFEDEVRMDTLSPDDPSLWVSLSTIGIDAPQMPIDVSAHPIVEITYRCLSENAVPAMGWTYPGGLNITRLPRTRRWRTVVHRAQHFSCPRQLDDVVVRLYSTARSTETLEIESICFRAMTRGEQEAIQKEEVRLRDTMKPPHYPVLDEFLPLGVYLNGETARRMAELLGIGLDEYWSLALEDIVRHHHNAVILEQFERMSEAEFRAFLGHAEAYGLRVLPMQDFPLDEDSEFFDSVVEEWIKPHVGSKAILAWSVCVEPSENDFAGLMRAKQKIEAADPHHPVYLLTRHPSAYPLYAPFFAASGFDRYTSHSPWEVGEMVRSHFGLGSTQQFWMAGPTFTWATGTPEWSTCPEMRIMVNSAFANGARGWFSYSYHNDPIWLSGSCMRTLTGPFLAFSDLWLELDQCMERLNPLLPLINNTWPWHMPKHWYAWSARAGDHYDFPEGVAPTSSYRLRGPDYNLYFIISNDIRGMATVTIDIPPDVMKGLEIYDITDYVHTAQWQSMRLERRLQMVPGQTRILLVAEAQVCAHWRDVIADRMIKNYEHQTAIHLPLAESYDVSTAKLRALMENQSMDGGNYLDRLHGFREAYGEFMNTIYDHAPFTLARSSILETMSATCACDGALCRLVRRGRMEEARTLGEEVIPLAREFTNLRLDLRNGHANRILGHCEDLSRRAQQTLRTIRETI